jgi:hypothetical protein
MNRKPAHVLAQSGTTRQGWSAPQILVQEI